MAALFLVSIIVLVFTQSRKTRALITPGKLLYEEAHQGGAEFKDIINNMVLYVIGEQDQGSHQVSIWQQDHQINDQTALPIFTSLDEMKSYISSAQPYISMQGKYLLAELLDKKLDLHFNPGTRHQFILPECMIATVLSEIPKYFYWQTEYHCLPLKSENTNHLPWLDQIITILQQKSHIKLAFLVRKLSTVNGDDAWVLAVNCIDSPKLVKQDLLKTISVQLPQANLHVVTLSHRHQQLWWLRYTSPIFDAQ